MSNIVIGIEGLVGAGKTSICRRLIKIMWGIKPVCTKGGKKKWNMVRDMLKVIN